MRSWGIGLLATLLAGCATAGAPRPVAPVRAPVVAPPVARAAPASLYTRIGGIDALRQVVPRFLENVAADERINYLFALSDLDALRSRLVEFFCSATGGPCRYGGRDMKTAHARLGIGPAAFDAMVEDLMKTFDEFHVPEREKGEILAALAPLRGDIVTVR